MLYLTTRNDKDAYTAARTLSQDSPAEGGFFVPYRLPVFSKEEIDGLKDRSFGETVSQILNLFFSSRLNGWDVDFSIGRNPIKLSTLNNKTVSAELWHNPNSDLDYVVQNLYRRVCPDAARNATEWFSVAVRIAVLFALIGEMQRQELITERNVTDIAVPGDDLAWCAAVFLAAKMGMPVNNILCPCSENAPLPELLRRCAVNTKTVADPSGLERLISTGISTADASRFADACSASGNFTISQEAASCLNRVLFTAAVGNSRIASVISSTYATNQYVIDKRTAMALAGIQDHRTGTGENRIALFLSDIRPAQN